MRSRPTTQAAPVLASVRFLPWAAAVPIIWFPSSSSDFNKWHFCFPLQQRSGTGRFSLHFADIDGNFPPNPVGYNNRWLSGRTCHTALTFFFFSGDLALDTVLQLVLILEPQTSPAVLQCHHGTGSLTSVYFAADWLLALQVQAQHYRPSRRMFHSDSLLVNLELTLDGLWFN